MQKDLNNTIEKERIMGTKKVIFIMIVITLIILSAYFVFKNQTITVITLGLLFIITFFKSEFYDLLKSMGL